MTERKKALYYVYHLVDPRTGNAFYVGKGKGNRAAQHERDAAKMKFQNAEKEAKIREIWASGNDVGRVIVEYFVNEKDAYAFEKQEIARIGRENLSNITSGHEPEEKKAMYRAIAFIEGMQRLMPSLPMSKRGAAHSLIAEMREAIAVCERVLAT